MDILEVYREFIEETLGISLIVGEKTEFEKFPGADQTFTIEALMQDGKALQAGTSHFLGQTFSKAQQIKFLDRDNVEKYGWTTSWGVSTRLIGGMIMSHGDDNGMIIPPKVASTLIKIIPIFKKPEERAICESFIGELQKKLETQIFDGEPISLEVDWRDIRGGEKYWDNIRKGFPVLVEVGKRDIEKNQLVVTRRDIGVNNKEFIETERFLEMITELLEDIQKTIFEKGQNHFHKNIVEIKDFSELQKFV